jgi:hypothetical protein
MRDATAEWLEQAFGGRGPRVRLRSHLTGWTESRPGPDRPTPLLGVNFRQETPLPSCLSRAAQRAKGLGNHPRKSSCKKCGAGMVK